MKDLNALNETLFDTLEKVRNDEMDVKKAASIVNVSNAIISSGKLQLQAYKLMKKNIAPAMLGIQNDQGRLQSPSVVGLEKKEVSLHEFAVKLGYDSEAEASSDLGSLTFKSKFEMWKANQ